MGAECKLIDGNGIAAQIRKEISRRVSEFYRTSRVRPRLAVILTGDNPASKVYVKKKVEACNEVGIASYVVDPLPSVDQWLNPQARLEDMLSFLNKNEEVHGILVQLPLPQQIDVHRVFDLIDPAKDVDVFNPANVGLLTQGRPRFLPCTPHAIQQMLSRTGIGIAGKHVVVINRSDVVGKPLSSMLIQDNDEFANATVTVCHDRTPRECLLEITTKADIVVVAVGIPGFLTPDMIRPGCVVVDVGINKVEVGINKVENKIVGDVAPACRKVAGYLTPVPGGVGPVTVAMLLHNTLLAAKLQAGV